MSQKIMIFAGDKIEQLMSQCESKSITVLANYGQSLLIKASKDDVEKITADTNYRVRKLPEKKSIQVRGYQLDTTG